MSAVVSDIGFTAVPRGAVHFGQHHSVVPHQRERDSTNGWAAWPGRSPSPATSSLSLNININHHHHHQYGCLYAKSHSIHSLSLPLPLYPFFLCLPRCLFVLTLLPLSGAVVAGSTGQHGDRQPAKHAEEGGGHTAQSAGVCVTQRDGERGQRSRALTRRLHQISLRCAYCNILLPW